MTLSQIRNQVHQWQRRFARELAVYRLRQLAEEIADDWVVASAEKEPLPNPLQVVQRVAREGPCPEDLHEPEPVRPAVPRPGQVPGSPANRPGPAPLGLEPPLRRHPLRRNPRVTGEGSRRGGPSCPLWTKKKEQRELKRDCPRLPGRTIDATGGLA